MVAEGRGGESLAVLEERKGCVTAFLAALQERADTLELELKRDQEITASRSKTPEAAPGPEPASVPAPAVVPISAPNVDKPPVYPILGVPHPPCACTAKLSDNRPLPHRHLRGWCTAIKLRDGLQCAWSCMSDQKFCLIHYMAHGTVVLPHKVKEGVLEAQRMRVARREGGTACRIADVKFYVEMLDKMREIVEEHQRLFSCRCEYGSLSRLCMYSPQPRSARAAPDSYEAVLKDLKRRRTSAGLLLGELSGRTDGKIAESQGQAETWATEFLAEVKHKDENERRKTAEDLLTVSDPVHPVHGRTCQLTTILKGAVVGGALTWFGIPWARSAVAGVVTAFVARKARDATDKS